MSRFKFAIVVDGDVAGTVALEDGQSPIIDRIIAAYQSNPTIIPIADETIAFGWTYDGANFYPPTSSLE